MTLNTIFTVVELQARFSLSNLLNNLTKDMVLCMCIRTLTLNSKANMCNWVHLANTQTLYPCKSHSHGMWEYSMESCQSRKTLMDFTNIMSGKITIVT